MKKEFIIIDDIRVELWWKAVKRITLVVYAADGRVRVSVPPATPIHLVQRVVRDRLTWINAQQARFRMRKPPVTLQFVDGERHFFLGKGYPLSITEGGRSHFVRFDPATGIRLYLRRGSTVQQRQRLLHRWYREQLHSRIHTLLLRWQPLVGEDVRELRIKRMKTRWGTCNIRARRIWLNLELIKKEEVCLEYILVHEMVHLLEARHNEVFFAHLDRLLPDWRSREILLKQEG